MSTVTSSDVTSLVARGVNLSEARVRQVIQNYTGYATRHPEPQAFLDLFRFYEKGDRRGDLGYALLGYQVGDICSIMSWNYAETLQICLTWRETILRLVAQGEVVTIYNAARLSGTISRLGDPDLSVQSSNRVKWRARIPARVQREYAKSYSVRNGRAFD